MLRRGGELEKRAFLIDITSVLKYNSRRGTKVMKPEPKTKLQEIGDLYNQAIDSVSDENFLHVYEKGIQYFETTHSSSILLMWLYSACVLRYLLEAESYIDRLLKKVDPQNPAYARLSEMLAFVYFEQKRIDEAYEIIRSQKVQLENRINIEQTLTSSLMLVAMNKNDVNLALDFCKVTMDMAVGETGSLHPESLLNQSTVILLLFYVLVNDHKNLMQFLDALKSSPAFENSSDIKRDVIRMVKNIIGSRGKRGLTEPESILIHELERNLSVLNEHSFSALAYEIPLNYRGDEYLLSVTREAGGELTGEIESIPGFVTCGDNEEHLKENALDLLGLFLAAA